MFELINSLITFALFVVAVLAGKLGLSGYLLGLPVLYALATTVPSYAKLVRRLHDTNLQQREVAFSGWGTGPWFLR